MTNNPLIRGILLWGGQNKARIIEEMLKESNRAQKIVIFDGTLTKPSFETSAFFINDMQVLNKNISTLSHYIVCVGGENGYARCKIAEQLEKLGLQPITIIHEKSFIEPTAIIGKGSQVMPVAVVHKFANIGKQAIINTNSTIDHGCEIGDGVHIMGNAAIAGMVKIGDFATIGTNATILPYINIGTGAYIGAGAVVTKDVDPYDVVIGVPAKFYKKNKLEFFDDVFKI